MKEQIRHSLKQHMNGLRFRHACSDYHNMGLGITTYKFTVSVAKHAKVELKYAINHNVSFHDFWVGFYTKLKSGSYFRELSLRTRTRDHVQRGIDNLARLTKEWLERNDYTREWIRDFEKNLHIWHLDGNVDDIKPLKQSDSQYCVKLDGGVEKGCLNYVKLLGVRRLQGVRLLEDIEGGEGKMFFILKNGYYGEKIIAFDGQEFYSAEVVGQQYVLTNSNFDNLIITQSDRDLVFHVINV